MAVPYYGDFAEDDTVDIPFNAFTSNDPAASATVTDLVAGDVKIYKDGGTDEKASADGVTVSVDFDGATGAHLIKIDTSDDTGAAGFWVTGSEYQVRINGATVDGGTVNAWIVAFSIERAGGVIALLKLIQAAVITHAAGTDVAADIIAVKAETALIVADTDELQTDDYPASIAAVKAETALIVADTNELQTDDIPGTLSTNDTSVDSQLAAIKSETALIVADTNELQTDDYPSSIAAVKAETALIVADTNELQTDDIPGTLSTIGGKVDTLDTVADAIKAVTDNLPNSGALSDLAAILTDTGTTLPGTLATIAGYLDTEIAAIKAKTDGLNFSGNNVLSDARAINSVAAAAIRLALSAGQIIPFTVDDTVAPSTTVFEADDITEATADHYNGRIVVFTTGVLAGQATDITDYELNGGKGKFTVTAMTEAPGNNDTGIII